MKNSELQSIWKSYDQKIESMIAINKELYIDIKMQKLNRQIGRLNRPKWTAILIGVPYALLLMGVAGVAFLGKAYLVALGFGAISLIVTALIIHYGYQLYLIGQVKNSGEILSTQEQLSKLRLSSFQSLNLAVFQLPFWSICWVSLDALQASPVIYGGINALAFLLLTYVSYWLFKKMSPQHETSKIRDFFLSGREWEPIQKSTEILEQIQEYEQ